MKTVLITGGAGFIGSHIAEEYEKKGYKVLIVDDLSSGKIDNITSLLKKDHVKFYQSDIRDLAGMEEIFKENRPDIINHHAAQKSVPYSVEDPLLDIDINCRGFMNLLILTQKYPIKNFIYISSGGALSKEIIGNDKSKESDLPQLKSPYAIDKFSGENFLKLYAELNKFNYTILRYANVFGPRQIADGECGVVPIFINNILENKDSYLMTYEDMPRGCTRDYVYISDIVHANMLSSEIYTDEVINIGSGLEVGILDIYEMIKEEFKSNRSIGIKGPRAGDVKRSVLDNAKALKVLGWKPNISLKEGITLLHEYYC